MSRLGRVRCTLALSAILASASCGAGPVAGPSPAVPPFAVAGIVSSAAGPVAQAVVEATTGPQKGVVATTDADGRFAFPTIFTAAVALRAAKDDYREQLIVVGSAQAALSFRLVLAINTFDPADVVGARFDADPACTALPPEVRSRTYAVVLAPSGPSYRGALSGAQFGKAVPGVYPGYDWNTLGLRIVDDTAEWSADDPPIWEWLSAHSDLLIDVWARGTIHADTLQWVFTGSFAYCPDSERDEGYPECNVPEISCRSSAHRLTLIRAGG